MFHDVVIIDFHPMFDRPFNRFSLDFHIHVLLMSLSAYSISMRRNKTKSPINRNSADPNTSLTLAVTVV